MPVSTQPPTFVVPTIDVSVLRESHPSPEALITTANEIRHACTTTGFFQIVNHTLDKEFVAKVFSYMKILFALPVEAKEAIKRSDDAGGYEIMGSQLIEAGTLPELKESFYVGEDGRAFTGKKFGDNQWPDDPSIPSDFKSTMLSYYTQLFSLSSKMFSLVALSLRLPPDHFDAFLEGQVALARFIHYPPMAVDAPKNQRGVGAHTDFGAMTLLLQDATGGLQVCPSGNINDESAWHDVVPQFDDIAIVCNIADFLQLWTNGLYRSTHHRVINSSGTDRYSIAFFNEGNLDYVVEPIGECVQDTGGTKKFERVGVKEHLVNRYKHSYEELREAYEREQG
ncbi:hypothetical protein HDU93_003116, partial [Gonapodya sp. JEL0774]